MVTPRTANPVTALAIPALSPEDYTKMLRDAGFINEPASEINRIKVDGLTFSLGDDMFMFNPKTNKPAFLAQVVSRPREYQSLWIDATVGDAINRPDDVGGFCKSFFDMPDQNRKYSESGASCSTCPVGPWAKNNIIDGNGFVARCKWKGDVELRVLSPDGTIADETIYTLTLSTTAIMEWAGTSRERLKGSVSELNFMQKLVRLGAASNPEDPQRGVARALVMLDRGGVVVEVRSLPAKSDDGARTWNVVSFTPVAIHDVEDAPALPAGGSDVALDNLPF